jgi:hypothetical protein
MWPVVTTPRKQRRFQPELITFHQSLLLGAEEIGFASIERVWGKGGVSYQHAQQ